MDASSPERSVRRSLLLHAAAVGLALGAVALGGGSLVLYSSSGLLLATAGLVACLLVALLVGLWVGTPYAEVEDPPARERLVVASFSVITASVFAWLVQMNESVAREALGRIGAVLLLLAIPAYTIGMALPVLLGWGERRIEAATGEFPGPGIVAPVAGGVLGGVAVGILITGFLLLQGLGPAPILLAASFVVATAVLLRGDEAPETREEVVYEADTPFHALRVTEVVYPGERQPERRLYLNGEEESGELVRSGAPTLAYVAAAEAWLAESTPRGASYLFLGGGAYTLPRRVAERDAGAAVTVVELDPEVTRAAYDHFGLRQEHGIQSVHGDARVYVTSAEGQSFDRIYVDVYGGQESLPYSLVTREALEAMRDRLSGSGLLAFNVIGTTHGPESTRFWSVVHTVAAVFPAVALYLHLGRDFPDRQNALLVGSADAGTVFPPRAGLFEPWPREEWPETPNAVIYGDLTTAEAPR